MRVCIIPARGGSVRIPQKNTRMFRGRPIIAYPINTAKESKLFDEVIVSTDDAKIADSVVPMGVRVHVRSWVDDEGVIGTQEVASRVVEKLELATDTAVCVLYATSPLITVDDLCATYEMHKATKKFVMTVGKNPLRDAGAIYWGSAFDYYQRTPLINPNTRIYPLPDERVCDINTFTDWATAEALFDMQQERNHEKDHLHSRADLDAGLRGIAD